MSLSVVTYFSVFNQWCCYLGLYVPNIRVGLIFLDMIGAINFNTL